MQIKRIPGCTRELGKPAGWDNERDGMCQTLPILDVKGEDGREWMISQWEPEPAELTALVLGGRIQLLVQGRTHPVVAIAVVMPEPE